MTIELKQNFWYHFYLVENGCNVFLCSFVLLKQKRNFELFIDFIALVTKLNNRKLHYNHLPRHKIDTRSFVVIHHLLVTSFYLVKRFFNWSFLLRWLENTRKDISFFQEHKAKGNVISLSFRFIEPFSLSFFTYNLY